jgi:L-malate glycosyltransferase
MKKSRIISVHLLNDFSGSPFVFRQSLQALLQEGYQVHLLTATPSGSGFLSGLDVMEHPLFYKWSRNKWLTLFYFLLSQMLMFFKMLGMAKKKDLVYINTMLPFGAALAARIKGSKVVYHIHEVSVKPAVLKKFLLWMVARTANHCIYVSEYVKDNTAVNVPSSVVYNALPTSFVERSGQWDVKHPHVFSVLMLCSLKEYKGVWEFVHCAEMLPQLPFVLVLNASQHEIDDFFHGKQLLGNIKLFPAQSDVHPFYQEASVVLNLSLPKKWIETFGMTALEAMYYGIPVIVPPVGGIVELVQNGINGFCVDASNTDLVSAFIQRLSHDRPLYERMSDAAYTRASCFTQEKFSKGILQVIEQKVEA